MQKTSRNDPCPCESGKKYKNCCIDKIIAFPVPKEFVGGDLKDAKQFSEMLKNHFEIEKFDSLEMMNKALTEISSNYNNEPKAVFLGLSPSQMSTLLDSPFSYDNSLFTIDLKDSEDFLDIPVFKQSVYFLKKLSHVKDLKCTQKGNLPTALVIELYKEFFSSERYARKPNREDDLPQITRLKHLLAISGLIKKRNNKLSLTKKGMELLSENKHKELFELIFTTYVNKWSWAFLDGYPEFFLIQNSCMFNLYILKKKCHQWMLSRDLAQIFLDAFPAITNEVPKESYSNPEGQIMNCFSLRFLERFCLPLGLLEYKEEKVNDGKYFKILQFYRTTTFFNEAFNFKS